MKISRNGVEIELTQREMKKAFDEITNAKHIENLLKVAEDMDYELTYEEAVCLTSRLKNFLSDDEYWNNLELFIEFLERTA